MPTHNLRGSNWDRQGFWLRINQVYVLFVQNSVRKLFFKAVFVKELFYPPGYDWLLKDLIYMRSP